MADPVLDEKIRTKLKQALDAGNAEESAKMAEALKSIREIDNKPVWLATISSMLPIIVSLVIGGLTLWFQTRQEEIRQAEQKSEARERASEFKRSLDLQHIQYMAEERKRASTYIQSHADDILRGTDAQFKFTVNLLKASTDEEVFQSFLQKLTVLARSSNQQDSINSASASGPIPAVPKSLRFTVYCQAPKEFSPDLQGKITIGLKGIGGNVKDWQLSNGLSFPDTLEVRYFKDTQDYKQLAVNILNSVNSSIQKRPLRDTKGAKFLKGYNASPNTFEIWFPKRHH